MGNCLITKLKGSVQNSNLNYFGTISLSVHPNGSLNPADDERSLVLKGDSPFTIIATDGGSFEVSTNRGTFINEYTVDNPDMSAQIFVASGDYKLILKDFKYQCVVMANGVWGQYRGLVYIDNIQDLCYSDFYNISMGDRYNNIGGFDLSPKVDAPTAYNFIITGIKEVRADLSAIAQHWSALQNILSLQTCTCVGTVDTLSTLINAKSIRLVSCEVSGTLESLLDGLYANGKVSDTLSTEFQGTSVTYNGAAITGPLSFSFNANGWQEVN